MTVPDRRLERRVWYRRVELVYRPGMALEALQDDQNRLRSERDLYLRLLGLGAQNELEAFLPEGVSDPFRDGCFIFHNQNFSHDPSWSHLLAEEAAPAHKGVSTGILTET